ncbi:MAG: hypothetical protein GWP91_22765, partial [Rhodobacterales bacterium]|nr:hypothetical protein [Rhodobacterales bacterium]
GLTYERTHDRWLPNLGGFASVLPFAAGFFTLGCLSSLGMPGTAGFVAEFMVFVGAWESDYSWWAVAGATGAFITAIYVMRACKDIFWGEGPAEQFKDLPPVKPTEHVALWLLGAALILFGVWPRLMLDLIDSNTPMYLQMVVEDALVKAGQ